MASIYNIGPYSGSKTYNTNDIVSHNGLFYYSKAQDVLNLTPSASSAYWGGTINIQDGLSTSEKPYFFWAFSYGANTQHEPKVDVIEFGDGYKQRIAQGTNNSLLNFQVSFNNRSEQEAAAILHFLSSKEGYQSFYFKCPSPYSVIKKMISPSWSSTFNFNNDYNIQAVFEEVS